MYSQKSPIMESYTYIYESAIHKNIHKADELADKIAHENFDYNQFVTDTEGNIQKYARSGREMRYNAEYIKHLVGEKIPFSKDQKSKAKFFLGALRIFGDILKNSDSEGEINSQCSDLNKILGIIVNDRNHINEYDNNLGYGQGENRILLSLEDLKNKFGKKVKDLSDKEKEEINSKAYTRNERYSITPCNTWEDMKQFGEISPYTKKQLTTWCVTQKNIGGKHAYDSYTNNGICRFYVCTIDGYEKLEPEVGDNCPLDEYGLSMIAICVNPDGSLKTCTCRWNHDNGGDDNIMDSKQISDLLGVNFFEVFKPKSPKDIIDSLEYNESDPLCSAGFRYDEDHNLFYRIEDNKLVKYNVCYNDSLILCLANTHFEWYDLQTGKEIEPPNSIDGDFLCPGYNNLTSLDGSPNKVNGTFSCHVCENLTSLKGAPSEVCKDFICVECNKLTTLEGSPTIVGREFDCSDCDNLTSLKGAPSEVGGYFYCYGCRKLKSIDDAPESIRNKIRW